MDDLTAVRVDPDGRLRDVVLPGAGYGEILHRELGGWPEFAFYGRSGRAVCLIVHETGLVDGLPANPSAIALAELMRGSPLTHPLCGPVLALGYLPVNDTMTSLPTVLRDFLRGLAPGAAT